MSDSPTGVWIVDDEPARLRMEAYVKALREQTLEVVTEWLRQPEPEPRVVATPSPPRRRRPRSRPR